MLRHRVSRSAAAFALICQLVAPAEAQTTAIKWVGKPGSAVGLSMALLDDVDGDGLPDIASGQPGAGAAVPTEGRVQVLSLRQGSVIAQWQGVFQQFLGTFVARVGDHDGDGLADLLIAGEPAQPWLALDARIVSPASGATLLLLPTPSAPEPTYRSAVGIGDLTGDGIPELVVGWPGAYGRGAVGLLDGRSGALLQEMLGDAALDNFGYSVAGLGDVDGDGLEDFAAGTFTQETTGHPPIPPAPGYVRVFSGAGALTIATLRAPDLAASFGRAITRLGDVDGDGVSELLVMAHQDLYCFRIGSPQPLWRRAFPPVTLPPSLPRLNGPLAGGVDLDGDGWPDAAVAYEDCQSAPVGGGCGVGNYVHAVSGLDGHRICDVRHPSDAILYGQGLALVGDLTGDGRGEIVASAPNEGFGSYSGALRVTSTVDLPLDPNLDLYSQISGSTQIRFNLDAGPANGGRLYLLLGSFGALFPGVPIGSGLFLPLETDDPWFQQTLLYPNVAPLSRSFGVLAADGSGSCTLNLSAANLGSLSGMVAQHAFVVFDATAVSFVSNAAPLSIL